MDVIQKYVVLIFELATQQLNIWNYFVCVLLRQEMCRYCHFVHSIVCSWYVKG